MLRLSLLLVLPSITTQAPGKDKAPVWTFRFEDYAVTNIFKGNPAPPVLATKDHRLYRTMIRQGAAKGANFAGHYTVAEWGCGSSCVSLVVVDAMTGHVYDPPFRVLTMDSATNPRNYHGPVYQLKSRLFIADGCPDEDEKRCGTSYYEWKDNRLRLLRFDSQPPAN